MATRKPAPPAAPPDDRATALWVPIDSVKLDPHNARERTPRNLAAITKSLDRFGQRKPLVLGADGVVYAGNGTLQAARALGWSEIWVSPTRLSGAEARAYAIADNRSGDLSQFDEIELSLQVGNLDADLLDVIGFDLAEIQELLPKSEETAPTAADGSTPARKSSHRQGLDGGARQGRIVLRLMIACDTVELFERALVATGLVNREQATQLVARSYLEGKGDLT